jgi:hypothetical protein
MAESSHPSKRSRIDGDGDGDCIDFPVPTRVSDTIGEGNMLPAFMVAPTDKSNSITQPIIPKLIELDKIFENLPNVQPKRLRPGTPEFNKIVSPINKADGFFALSVYLIEDTHQTMSFKKNSGLIARENGGNSNSITMFHCASTGGHISLLKGTVDFTSIAFTEDFYKANDYSLVKGNPSATRLLLICDVELGRTKELSARYFDRKHVQAPKGFHSVRGFINIYNEYFVFNKSQIRPIYLILYNFTNKALELEKSINFPVIIKGIFIKLPKVLIVWFMKIYKLIKPDERTIFKDLISELLVKKIEVKHFLEEVSKILKAQIPPSLETKIIFLLASIDSLGANEYFNPAAASADSGQPASASSPANSAVSATEPELVQSSHMNAANILISLKK